MTQNTLDLLFRLNREECISTVQLVKEFHCSEKTLRTRIKETDELIREHGAFVEVKRGCGYRLRITDRELFLLWQKNAIEEMQKNIPASTDERITYILSFLLNHKEYLKREELADFLCVTEKTISSDIKRVELILKQYDLRIERKPSYGMLVTGEEFKKRQCILNRLILMNASSYFVGEHEQKIQKSIGRILKEVAASYEMTVPEIALNNLILYLSVLAHRMKHGFTITGEECAEWKRDVAVYKIADDIMQKLQKEELIDSFEPGEVYYTSLFLWGNRVIENKTGHVANYVIPAYEETLINHMLEEVYLNFGINFYEDLNLRMCLVSHLAALDVRMKYNIRVDNIHMEDIKERYFFAFMVAKQATSVLSEYYEKQLSDEEIGYFALLFAMKLKNTTAKVRKLKLLLFCATGKIGSQFLKFRLEEEFGEYIEKIEMCSIYEIESIDFSEFDYVLTTIPIDKLITVPVILINDFFDQSELLSLHKRLSQFANSDSLQEFYRKELFFKEIPGDTKEEVLSWLCKETAKVRNVPDELYDCVIERERLGSTDFGNLVAMPHPNRMIMNQNLVCVGILKKPVLWKRNQVQFIVLTAIANSTNEATQRFFDVTSKLLLDGAAIKKIIEAPSYENLMEQLFLKKEGI